MDVLQKDRPLKACPFYFWTTFLSGIESIFTMPLCPTPANENELLSSRVFQYPRAVVFDAYADKEKVKHWWGPDGFTNTIHELDLRVGGKYKLTMHGSDGKNYENCSHFEIVDIPKKLVLQRETVPLFNMTMTFEEVDGGAGTKLTWHTVFPKPIDPKFREFITAANQQNYNRLEAFLKNR